MRSHIPAESPNHSGIDPQRSPRVSGINPQGPGDHSGILACKSFRCRDRRRKWQFRLPPKTQKPKSQNTDFTARLRVGALTRIRPVDLWQIYQTIANGVHDEFGGLVQPEGVHDVGAMYGNGVYAEVQVACDFLIRFTDRDQL